MYLKTRRLSLRPITPDDAEQLFAYRSNKLFNQYQGWVPEKFKEAISFIDNTAKVFDQPDTWFQMVIVQDERLVGDIGLHFLADGLQVELGITLNENYQKQGLAKEAMQGVINYLFFNLDKHRITCSVDPKNHRSVKLLEALGFRKEAHFIESYKHKEVWVDDVVYAILKKEWHR